MPVARQVDSLHVGDGQLRRLHESLRGEAERLPFRIGRQGSNRLRAVRNEVGRQLGERGRVVLDVPRAPEDVVHPMDDSGPLGSWERTRLRHSVARGAALLHERLLLDLGRSRAADQQQERCDEQVREFAGPSHGLGLYLLGGCCGGAGAPGFVQDQERRSLQGGDRRQKTLE